MDLHNSGTFLLKFQPDYCWCWFPKFCPLLTEKYFLICTQNSNSAWNPFDEFWERISWNYSTACDLEFNCGPDKGKIIESNHQILTVIEQHFHRRQASTELQCIEWLALEIMKEYDIWLGMTQVITSQREINNWTRNMNFNQKCNEHLVFKSFLIIMIQNINVWTHLALVGHRNSLWNTR